MKCLILFLMMLALPVRADDWTTTDKVLFATSSALLVADWAQTRYTVKNPEQFHDHNRLLGEYPSMGKVNAYFASVLVLNYFVTDALPPKWRTAYQAGLITLELVVVGHNKNIGIGMSF